MNGRRTGLYIQRDDFDFIKNVKVAETDKEREHAKKMAEEYHKKGMELLLKYNPQFKPL